MQGMPAGGAKVKAPRVRMKDLTPAQRKIAQAEKRLAAERERQQFRHYCMDAGLPEPEPELRFQPERQWRFDYGWPGEKVALEVDGGVWSGGRHTRGAGFLEDMAKLSEAAALGWRIIRCTPDDLYGAATLDRLRRALTPTP